MAQVKGSQIIAIVKTLRTHRASAEDVLAPELHHYLSDRVLVNVWYPEQDHRDLLIAMGNLIKNHVPGDVWQYIGEEGAKRDLAGTYAAILRQGDPVATLQRMPQGWTLYHDTGKMRITLTGPTNARIDLHGYNAACREVAGVTAGYVCGLLRASGAKSPKVEILACPNPIEGPSVWAASWQ